ncbi:MAG: substrate-binding domain-containing protein, partial [Gammaproteobacteria bacterium]|nr:substrate-binding domain-containing protein [Gammaproteobacteria bacterium]
YDLDNEVHEVRALVSRGVDGLVLVGTSHREDVYRLLQHKSIPYVNTWSFHHDAPHPCVGFDNRQVAFRITQYLLDLGHRRIGAISGILKDNDRASERVAGINQALADRGQTMPPEWLIERRYSVSSGRAAFRQIMSIGTRPTAIICGNDVLAFGAVIEAQAMGFNIPSDISITGFDDLELSSQISPSLTTAHVPVEDMGRAAAEYLLARIDDIITPERTELEVRLIVRETTGPVATP